MHAPAPTHDAYLARRTFNSLDGLRCMSIAAVVWHHSDAPALVHQVWPAARFGFLGVDLFFAISGFLIVTLLLRERDRKGEISLRNFYVRRSLRILPVYYGLLAGLALLFLVLRRGTPASEEFATDLPLLVLYLTNWVPAHGWLEITWSLAAEEQFYLVWPPVEKWLRRHAMTVLLVIIVIGQIIQLGLVDSLLGAALGWAPNEPRMLRETTFTPICFGVLLAHLLHRAPGYARIARVLGPRWVAPALLVVLILYANLLPAEIRGVWRLAVHVLMILLLAACVLRDDHGLARLLEWRPLARIGALSYGIYLFHQICIAIAQKGLAKVGLAHPLLVLVTAFVLVWLAAELSYRHFESRFLRLKERFA
ncbi:MAG: acyltransferase [Deltaproteobacteria bacterium]|nr:acyltransferase [Nannocystaceae bacterium]